ncbi:hypothetical protein BDW22DRAFT_1349620 [Trametopsis cervina]|nr:hypothetical protein BDW22DRAFT_1349620 [Trametopsis cervina]
MQTRPLVVMFLVIVMILLALSNTVAASPLPIAPSGASSASPSPTEVFINPAVTKIKLGTGGGKVGSFGAGAPLVHPTLADSWRQMFGGFRNSRRFEVKAGGSKA